LKENKGMISLKNIYINRNSIDQDIANAATTNTLVLQLANIPEELRVGSETEIRAEKNKGLTRAWIGTESGLVWAGTRLRLTRRRRRGEGLVQL
jgi:hypothetical protein